MSFGSQETLASPLVVAAQESERAKFLRQVYLHLAGAIGAFILLEGLVFTLVPEQTLLRMTAFMLQGYMWLGVLLAFMAVGWFAENMARNAHSRSTQYMGLSLYVFAEAVIFVPLLVIAQRVGAAAGQNLILEAAVITGAAFIGLTAIVLMTGADFRWIRTGLLTVTWVAIVVVLAGALFGFTFGLLVVGLFIAIACAWIVYNTSEVLHGYYTHQPVAAALALFASVALLFWYVLQFVISMSRD